MTGFSECGGYRHVRGERETRGFCTLSSVFIATLIIKDIYLSDRNYSGMPASRMNNACVFVLIDGLICAKKHIFIQGKAN